MMKIGFAKLTFAMAMLAGLNAASWAANPTFSRYTPGGFAESTILTATSKADYDGAGLAVNAATGDMYVVDSDGADVILKITSAGVVTVFKTDADLLAAIDAVNGASATTAINPRQLAISADGDLIVLGFATGSNQDALLSINTGTGAITVVHTGVDAAASTIDGSGALTVIGNTAYVGTDRSNGTLAEVYAIDTNAAGPTATATPLVTEASIDALYDTLQPGHTFTAADLAINSLTNDGVDLYGIVSATATAPDDVVKITTAGVITRVISKATVVAALDAMTVAAGDITDVGYGAIAKDSNGAIWLLNSFGQAPHDDGVIRYTAGGVVEAIEEGNGSTAGTLTNMLGTTSCTLTNDTLVFVNSGSLAGSIFYLENAENGSGEGIATATFSSDVNDWTMY